MLSAGGGLGGAWDRERLNRAPLPRKVGSWGPVQGDHSFQQTLRVSAV